MKATLFRFAWWLARKTAPNDCYSHTRVRRYNDGSTASIIVLGESEGEDDPDAMMQLSEDIGNLSDDIRYKAAERALDLEIEATLASHDKGAEAVTV